MPAPHDLRRVRFLHAETIYTALLLEGQEHPLRLLQEIPLDEAEQAAVEDGVTAYEFLDQSIARS